MRRHPSRRLRVLWLKKKIEEGAYRVDADRLASRMLAAAFPG